MDDPCPICPRVGRAEQRDHARRPAAGIGPSRTRRGAARLSCRSNSEVWLTRSTHCDESHLSFGRCGSVVFDAADEEHGPTKHDAAPRELAEALGRPALAAFVAPMGDDRRDAELTDNARLPGRDTRASSVGAAAFAEVHDSAYCRPCACGSGRDRLAGQQPAPFLLRARESEHAGSAAEACEHSALGDALQVDRQLVPSTAHFTQELPEAAESAVATPDVNAVDRGMPIDERLRQLVHGPPDAHVRSLLAQRRGDQGGIHDVADRAEAHDQDAFGQ